MEMLANSNRGDQESKIFIQSGGKDMPTPVHLRKNNNGIWNEEGTSINDDHVYVNKFANIPSIDIIHLDPSTGNRSFFEHWHTINDNMEHIDKKSLKIVGNVVLDVIYHE